HLDDGLADAAAAEVLAGAPREALEACRHGRQVLGIFAGEALRGPDGEAVAGEDEGLVDVVDPGDEIVKEPAQVGIGTGAWTRQPLRVAHVVPPWSVFGAVRAGARAARVRPACCGVGGDARVRGL